MKTSSLYYWLILFVLASCHSKKEKESVKNVSPEVTQNGEHIVFPDTASLRYFKTKPVNNKNIYAEFTAIGNIGATVLASNTGATQNIVLFDNPDLAGNYTLLMQHQINIRQIQNINIKQKQIELERAKDLLEHGAATGHELLIAQAALSMEQTNLANEKAALIEHESKLKAGGFNPELLQESPVGTAYIICEIPENQISKLKIGSTCHIYFASFPDEKYTGRIDNVADVVDNITRMIKVRILVNNSSSKLKAGMFANVLFGLNEGNFISIDNSSLITVQGKSYVFVKKSKNEFERREIQTGQQIDERVIVLNGLTIGEEIAVEGVLQLKGLSFGY